jgi:hypothetical protein
MALGLSRAQGLFSTLRERLRHPDTKSRLRLSTSVHDFLDDFRCLAATLSERPTKIIELLPHSPLTIGASAALGTGMIGIHSSPQPDESIQPCLWCQLLPRELTTRLVTDTNPSGGITISDLELGVTVAHHEVLAHYVDIRERTTNNLHNNTSAVYWQRKGSTTTTKAAAYILHLQALHQWFHRYVPMQDYLAGNMNAMADDCSRL